jgi:hypothetical protein
MKSLLCTSACALALALTAAAQAGNPVANALRNSERMSSSRMTAAAQLMPAGKYSFKPTAGSMTFGQLILHVATSNDGMCHMLTNYPAAPRLSLKPTSPKAQLVAALKSSWAYCSRALAGFSDADLSKSVPFFGGRKVSAATLVLALSGDWSDHYSQQAAYLRHNGILPPTARGRGTP